PRERRHSANMSFSALPIGLPTAPRSARRGLRGPSGARQPRHSEQVVRGVRNQGLLLDLPATDVSASPHAADHFGPTKDLLDPLTNPLGDLIALLLLSSPSSAPRVGFRAVRSDSASRQRNVRDDLLLAFQFVQERAGGVAFIRPQRLRSHAMPLLGASHHRKGFLAFR